MSHTRRDVPGTAFRSSTDHQLPIDMGGGEGKCLYIDTEGTFVCLARGPATDRSVLYAFSQWLSALGLMERRCWITLHMRAPTMPTTNLTCLCRRLR